MKELKVEYLVIINTENSFCSSKKAFNNLLSSYDNIIITKGKVKHKGLEVEYDLQTEEIEENKQRFFHLKFVSKNFENIDQYTQLLKAVRGILGKATNKQPQTLWDDISKYYSLKVYPLIHNIENLLRKLITKFMLTNIGLGWEKESIPEEVKKSGRNKPSNSNYLYEVDFIQLSNFLFLKYSNVELNSLIDKITSLDNDAEIKLSELDQFVPKSNWERYFSPIVDCDNNYLEKRWKKLYEYRCKVAHNNAFTKVDFEITLKLYKEIKEKLLQAIDNLDKIELSEDEKESIAENIAGKTNELYGLFLNNWKIFTHSLFSLIKDFSDIFKMSFSNHHRVTFENYLERNKYNTIKLIQILADDNLIDKIDWENIQELRRFRNILVHETEIIFDEVDLKYNIARLQHIINSLNLKILPTLVGYRMQLLNKYKEEEEKNE